MTRTRRINYITFCLIVAAFSSLISCGRRIVESENQTYSEMCSYFEQADGTVVELTEGERAADVLQPDQVYDLNLSDLSETSLRRAIIPVYLAEGESTVWLEQPLASRVVGQWYVSEPAARDDGPLKIAHETGGFPSNACEASDSRHYTFFYFNNTIEATAYLTISGASGNSLRLIMVRESPYGDGCEPTHCNEYSDQAVAQNAYNQDPVCLSRLDRDKDGEACEEPGNMVRKPIDMGASSPTSPAVPGSGGSSTSWCRDRGSRCGCSGRRKSECSTTCCKWTVGSGCGCR